MNLLPSAVASAFATPAKRFAVCNVAEATLLPRHCLVAMVCGLASLQRWKLVAGNFFSCSYRGGGRDFGLSFL